MKLSKIERRVLQRFKDEWEGSRNGTGSETLREDAVAGSLGVEREVVSRCVAAFLSYGYLRKRGTSPDYQITPEGIKALKPWPVRYANEIIVVIVGATIASLLIWLIRFLIQTVLS